MKKSRVDIIPMGLEAANFDCFISMRMLAGILSLGKCVRCMVVGLQGKGYCQASLRVFLGGRTTKLSRHYFDFLDV